MGNTPDQPKTWRERLGGAAESFARLFDVAEPPVPTEITDQQATASEKAADVLPPEDETPEAPKLDPRIVDPSPTLDTAYPRPTEDGPHSTVERVLSNVDTGSVRMTFQSAMDRIGEPFVEKYNVLMDMLTDGDDADEVAHYLVAHYLHLFFNYPAPEPVEIDFKDATTLINANSSARGVSVRIMRHGEVDAFYYEIVQKISVGLDEAWRWRMDHIDAQRRKASAETAPPPPEDPPPE
jgi:hypothetical protein